MDPLNKQPDDAQRMTEARNPRTEFIDRATAFDIARIINEEDGSVHTAVKTSLDEISCLMEAAAESFRSGGRLVYFGAGTSGRLAVLDASECPPTFGVSPDRVVAYIAGGDTALRTAVEGAEDDPDGGVRDVEDAGVGPADVVVGVVAGGRTPYVIGAIEEARRRGARTGAIVAVGSERCLVPAHVVVSLPVGPEVIAGSTRMKAGTATKMALNMISTGAMILTGRVYRNMMIDLRPGSAKLMDRAVRILREVTGMDTDSAAELVDKVNGHVKLAVVMAVAGVDANEAQTLLDKEQGVAYRIIEQTAENIERTSSGRTRAEDRAAGSCAGAYEDRVHQNDRTDGFADER